jgi:YidC/Oxa1 family membrane protein insertase
MNFINEFFATIMNFIYTYLSFDNYAVAIIFFTLLVKLVLLPLDIKSRKSMRRMTEAQAGLAKINEKYKNDPEKKNQKTMEYYKKEKVSPMGGCLPVLIQFPILIAMWTAIRYVANEQIVMMYLNVQAGADFTAPGFLQSFLWVHNLWQPDNFMQDGTVIPMWNNIAQVLPVSGNSILSQANIADIQRNYMQVMQGAIAHYNTSAMNGWGILPLLVCGTQLITQRLMPQQQPQADQTNKQAGMMKTMNMIMPFIFLFICWGYSAAFSLYFAISNVYGLVQNILLNRYFKRQDEQKRLQEGGANA